MTDSAKVITFVGELRRERIVFEGLQEDAEVYLRDHFPRLHVEPGTDYGDAGPAADAVVQAPDGTRQFWDGRELVDWEPPATASNPSNSNSSRMADAHAAELAERDAEILELRRQVQQQSAPPVEPTIDPAVAERDAEIERLRAQLAAQPPAVESTAEPPADLEGGNV